MRIVPGIAIGSYGGCYWEGEHRYNLATWLKANPQHAATLEKGVGFQIADLAFPLSFPRSDYTLSACPSAPETMAWMEEGVAWLAETFDVGGINIEAGDYGVCGCGRCVARRANEAEAARRVDAYGDSWSHTDMADNFPRLYRAAKAIKPDLWLYSEIQWDNLLDPVAHVAQRRLPGGGIYQHTTNRTYWGRIKRELTRSTSNRCRLSPTCCAASSPASGTATSAPSATSSTPASSATWRRCAPSEACMASRCGASPRPTTPRWNSRTWRSRASHGSRRSPGTASSQRMWHRCLAGSTPPPSSWPSPRRSTPSQVLPVERLRDAGRRRMAHRAEDGPVAAGCPWRTRSPAASTWARDPHLLRRKILGQPGHALVASSSVKHSRMCARQRLRGLRGLLDAQRRLGIVGLVLREDAVPPEPDRVAPDARGLDGLQGIRPDAGVLLDIGLDLLRPQPGGPCDASHPSPPSWSGASVLWRGFGPRASAGVADASHSRSRPLARDGRARARLARLRAVGGTRARLGPTTPERPRRAPDDQSPRRHLGAAKGAWDEFARAAPTEVDGLDLGWRYYPDGKAWLCRAARRGRTICWISVWHGAFRAAFYFGAKADAEIEHLDIDGTLKESYASSARVGKLKLLRVEVADVSRLPDLYTLMRHKLTR